MINAKRKIWLESKKLNSSDNAVFGDKRKAMLVLDSAEKCVLTVGTYCSEIYLDFTRFQEPQRKIQ